MINFSSDPVPLPVPTAATPQPLVLGLDKGVWMAGFLFCLWLVSLVGLFVVPIGDLPLPLKLLGAAWQMFLYTGLFVTAHDAMHGSVAPRAPQLNDAIGTLMLFAYALFPFGYMRQMHGLHHKLPCRSGDPDFHNGRHANFFSWFSNFMGNYWSWTRLLLLIGCFHVVHQFFHIPEANLTWFWVGPSVASSLQLFLFGTFLPHSEPADGYQNECRATSSGFSEFLSLITCYHFGYHEEHHDFPHLAWWQLPIAQRARATL
jgi:beta-carotene/zeaxanthin 4-ketolase